MDIVCALRTFLRVADAGSFFAAPRVRTVLDLLVATMREDLLMVSSAAPASYRRRTVETALRSSSVRPATQRAATTATNRYQ